MEGAQGLVDLDWSQCTPIFHPDNIDHDPRFSQYPFQEGDDYDDDDKEDMEVESQPPGGAGDASWHHRLIPSIPTNACQRLTLLNLLKLQAHPGAHILTLTLQWRWEVLVWLPEAQTCVA